MNLLKYELTKKREHNPMELLKSRSPMELLIKHRRLSDQVLSEVFKLELFRRLFISKYRRLSSISVKH